MMIIHSCLLSLIAESLRSKVKDISRWFDLYKNDSKGFEDALIQTLEAEVRSKFQTNKRINDAVKGLPVDVPFDVCNVQYFWVVRCQSGCSFSETLVIMKEDTSQISSHHIFFLRVAWPHNHVLVLICCLLDTFFRFLFCLHSCGE